MTADSIFRPGSGPSPELLDDCVHCGFCLPACPTYRLWGEEMDSPRGRIHLMRGLVEGDPLDDATIGHFDACLGCMACVPACPSGVQYDTLIEQTRAALELTRRRPWRERLLHQLIFGLFPYPRRLRLVVAPLRLYQRSGLAGFIRRSGLLARFTPRLAALEALAPRLSAPGSSVVPTGARAAGERRLTVALLTGCVQGAFFPAMNAATQRVLAAEGCEVVVPPAQGCCGALSLHGGREAEAARFARALIGCVDLDRIDVIVTNAAGCGSALKRYAHLLADDPAWAGRAQAFETKIADVSEVLARLGTRAPRHPLPLSVAYHDACHLAHAQGVRSEPRQLLAGVPGLAVAEIGDGDVCCGSAGIYNILQPETAGRLGRDKAQRVAATGAQALVSGNPGCLMQIRSALDQLGSAIPVLHTVELLDAAIRGVPASTLLAGR